VVRYVKVSIISDFVVDYPDFSPIFMLFFPILYKLDNWAL